MIDVCYSLRLSFTNTFNWCQQANDWKSFSQNWKKAAIIFLSFNEVHCCATVLFHYLQGLVLSDIDLTTCEVHLLKYSFEVHVVYLVFCFPLFILPLQKYCMSYRNYLITLLSRYLIDCTLHHIQSSVFFDLFILLTIEWLKKRSLSSGKCWILDWIVASNQS